MSQATRILLALIVGLGLGILTAAEAAGWAERAATLFQPIGTAWLNGLRMTIIPLIVALLITGIAVSAQAARASRLTARAVMLIAALLVTSSVTAAVLTPALLAAFPMPAAAAEALRSALRGTEPVGDVPAFADFIASIIPTNPVDAAANDSILPLIIFTTVFAFAILKLPKEPRDRLTGFFAALQEAMLVIIGWVLWLAPIGVFALAYVVGARAGAAAFGALLHYILIVSAVGIAVSLLAYPLAVFGGRIPFMTYVKGVAPAQAIAISTQSSLASLPIMLRKSEDMGVPEASAGVVLPLAVAIFRVTGPCMNLAVAIYVAHWFGIELSAWQLAIGVAAASLTTLGAVSLPGQVSFVTSIAPISLAMGVPVEPLALLIAVETLPDIVRTVGNVMMDVSVTATASRLSEEGPAGDAGSADPAPDAGGNRAQGDVGPGGGQPHRGAAGDNA